MSDKILDYQRTQLNLLCAITESFQRQEDEGEEPCTAGDSYPYSIDSAARAYYEAWKEVQK